VPHFMRLTFGWGSVLPGLLILSACNSSGLPSVPGPVSTPTTVGATSTVPVAPAAPVATPTSEPPAQVPPTRALVSSPTLPAQPTPSAPVALQDGVVLVGAGDIATCDSDQDERTAKLLDAIGGTVFTLGDNAYGEGTASQFKKCYEPTWGRHKERTRPAAGNHEYRTEDAAPYFDYFGEAAGEPGKGYYSYDLGSWHIVVLNSNCKYIGGCDEDSAQWKWLRTDLQAHPARCTLAYWHHPLLSAGNYEKIDAVKPLWQILYDAGAEVVLSGHDHNYQRYAPQDPDGAPDARQGIRQFIVGTGGKDRYSIERQPANLEVADDNNYGVLKLSLYGTGYNWEFISTEGSTSIDSGQALCH
jgi:acid phosphatase type 7